jgi:hypothetical protein
MLGTMLMARKTLDKHPWTKMGEIKALEEAKAMERCRGYRRFISAPQRAFNIVMTPLADQNLESLLENERDDK